MGKILISKKEYESLLNFVSLSGEVLYNLIIDIKNQTCIELNPSVEKYCEYLEEVRDKCRS